jgi:hypothetical protein
MSSKSKPPELHSQPDAGTSRNMFIRLQQRFERRHVGPRIICIVDAFSKM